MTENKSHNITPDTDDMEYVDMMGLDPTLAYTPEINDAIIEHIYSTNVQHYIDQGDEEQTAKSKAGVHRKQAQATIDYNVKARGY